MFSMQIAPLAVAPALAGACSVVIQFVAGKVKRIIPAYAISAGIDLYRVKQSVFFQCLKYRPLVK